MRLCVHEARIFAYMLNFKCMTYHRCPRSEHTRRACKFRSQNRIYVYVRSELLSLIKVRAVRERFVCSRKTRFIAHQRRGGKLLLPLSESTPKKLQIYSLMCS